MARASRGRGQSAIEFVIVLPILVALTLTTLTIGQVLIVQAKINAVAREAARAGAEAGLQEDAGAVAMQNAERWARRVYDERQPDCLAWDAAFHCDGGGCGTYARGGTFTARVTCDYELPFDPAGVVSALARFSGSGGSFQLGVGGVVTFEAESSYRIQHYKSRFP